LILRGITASSATFAFNNVFANPLSSPTRNISGFSALIAVIPGFGTLFPSTLSCIFPGE
jgi:hypothetical protein